MSDESVRKMSGQVVPIPTGLQEDERRSGPDRCPTCGGTREWARMLGGKSLDTTGTGRCTDAFHSEPADEGERA